MASDAEKRISEQVSGKTFDQAVISLDGKHLYPVHAGIPLLIPQAVIDLSGPKSTLDAKPVDANIRRLER